MTLVDTLLGILFVFLMVSAFICAIRWCCSVHDGLRGLENKLDDLKAKMTEMTRKP